MNDLHYIVQPIASDTMRHSKRRYHEAHVRLGILQTRAPWIYSCFCATNSRIWMFLPDTSKKGNYLVSEDDVICSVRHL